MGVRQKKSVHPVRLFIHDDCLFGKIVREHRRRHFRFAVVEKLRIVAGPVGVVFDITGTAGLERRWSGGGRILYGTSIWQTILNPFLKVAQGNRDSRLIPALKWRSGC